jgi:hypothetical protein
VAHHVLRASSSGQLMCFIANCIFLIFTFELLAKNQTPPTKRSRIPGETAIVIGLFLFVIAAILFVSIIVSEVSSRFCTDTD